MLTAIVSRKHQFRANLVSVSLILMLHTFVPFVLKDEQRMAPSSSQLFTASLGDKQMHPKSSFLWAPVAQSYCHTTQPQQAVCLLGTKSTLLTPLGNVMCVGCTSMWKEQRTALLNSRSSPTLAVFKGLHAAVFVGSSATHWNIANILKCVAILFAF